MEVILYQLLLFTLFATSGNCQDCSYPTNDDVEGVIRKIITSSQESPANPSVNINQFHVICLAFGYQKDLYRAVSVVVEYTCSGNSNCPVGSVVEQIESECDDGDWSLVSSVQGSIEDTRSQSPLADFSTEMREDCSFCLSPELAGRVSLITDLNTHCIGKHKGCQVFRRDLWKGCVIPVMPSF